MAKKRTPRTKIDLSGIMRRILSLENAVYNKQAPPSSPPILRQAYGPEETKEINERTEAVKGILNVRFGPAPTPRLGILPAPTEESQVGMQVLRLKGLTEEQLQLCKELEDKLGVVLRQDRGLQPTPETEVNESLVPVASYISEQNDRLATINVLLTSILRRLAL